MRTRNSFRRCSRVLVSALLALAVAVAVPIGIAPAQAQTASVLVLDSVQIEPNTPWTVSADGRSASRDGDFGRQESNFAAPASVPAAGVSMTWTLVATATVGNLATECDVRTPGFTATANPALHVAAFSPGPGKTDTKTVSIIMKPNSVAPGATATIRVGCFTGFSVEFRYKAAAAATTTAPTTTPSPRCGRAAISGGSGGSGEGSIRVVPGGDADIVFRSIEPVVRFGLRTQAVDLGTCEVALEVIDPPSNSRRAIVRPGAIVKVRARATEPTFPGETLQIQTRRVGQPTFGAENRRCPLPSCVVEFANRLAGAFEVKAVRFFNGEVVAESELVLLRWEEPETRKLRFDYTMPDRLVDRDGDMFVEYPDKKLYLVKPQDWFVDITVTDCPDPRKAGVKYSWTYSPAAGGAAKRLTVKPVKGCVFRAEFPGPGKQKSSGEGEFDVTVKAVANGEKYEGKERVAVQDLLVLGIGDSLASGEGSPEIRAPNTRWQSLQCDRSRSSYQALVAKRLEDLDRRTSVTFIHLACSGAKLIDHSPNNGVADGGVLDPYYGIDEVSMLRPQVEVGQSLSGGREVDVVLLSGGVNDLEFGNVAYECAKTVRGTALVGRGCGDVAYTEKAGVRHETLRAFIQARLATLPGSYKKLDDGLSNAFGASFPNNRFPGERVFITEYPDIWGPCQEVQLRVVGAVDLKREDLMFINDEARVPLNRAVGDTATALSWNPVSAPSFGSRGYCDEARWIVTGPESVDKQENINGGLHPNEAGHIAIGEGVEAAVRLKLYAGTGRARAPQF